MSVSPSWINAGYRRHPAALAKIVAARRYR